MEYIPIKTRIMQPPKDNLFTVLDESLVDIQEGDIVLITSKVFSVHHGRCCRISEVLDKAALVRQEADAYLDVDYRDKPLTLKHHALISAAGIDESNGGGYYTLLPENPYEDAREVWQYLRSRNDLKKLAVIVTDSHSTPLRFGGTSISIGFWGMCPVQEHRGRKDLFNRPLEISATNIVDSLAAGSAVVSGEADECQPIVVARNAPDIKFTEGDRRKDLLVSRKEDIYREFFREFKN